MSVSIFSTATNASHIAWHNSAPRHHITAIIAGDLCRQRPEDPAHLAFSAVHKMNNVGVLVLIAMTLPRSKSLFCPDAPRIGICKPVALFINPNRYARNICVYLWCAQGTTKNTWMQELPLAATWVRATAAPPGIVRRQLYWPCG